MLHFSQPWFFLLLLALPGLWLLLRREAAWRERGRRRFASLLTADLFPAAHTWNGPVRSGLWSAAFICLVCGLARPQVWSGTAATAGRDLAVYYVLDCSPSMGARDVAPSRLEAAKAVIRRLEAMGAGDRGGLVVFAGSARVLCPLTSDHDALLAALAGVQTRNFEVKGSQPAAGLELAVAKIAVAANRRKAVVLLTDGEATRPEDLPAVARQAVKAGITVFSIGVGTEAGARIPWGRDFWGKEQFRVYRGQYAVSRLQAADLYKASRMTGGIYTAADAPLATVAGAVARVWDGWHAEPAKGARPAAVEWYAWFAAAAFLLLAGEWLAAAGRIQRT